MEKNHLYHFKFMYDAPNSVTGKYTRSWTGRAGVIAPSYQVALSLVNACITKAYPHADNIRNIRRV